MTTGVILARTGSTFRVQTQDGEITAVLSGKLKHKDDGRVVAGDVVEFEPSHGGAVVIDGVRPRKSVLARRASAGGRVGRRAQPIAANVDQVVVVAAARDPELNLRMLDRLLVIAETNRLPAVIVLNKIDLDEDALGVCQRRFGPAGYQILPTSVKAVTGLPALRDLLRGRASVLTGPSGVGKSSLINAFHPGLKLRIGEVNEKWGKGRHTTTAAQLVPLGGVIGAAGGGGGYVVDTPGLREVAAWGLDAEALGACFPEFRPFLDGCRFDNCRHLGEPGCAVRKAAEEGAFEADRLASYQRIYEEVSAPSWSSGPRRGH